MKDRTPAPRDQRPPLPDFDPVPRKCARHDGWTPQRQKAFIEALADTGSVSRACAMVNMTTVGAYFLRRQPGAEGFRRAWEAALDFGVARMKDIAFERAVEGVLVPVIAGGKLLGYRRIYNDRLLMFCLRHYGQDAQGRRTRVEYFSTRASAGSSSSSLSRSGGEGDRSAQLSGGGASARAEASTTSIAGRPGDGREAQSGALAHASATVVRTIITGNDKDPLALSLAKGEQVIQSFDPADLDDLAQAQIAQALEECAARRRETFGTPDDEEMLYLPVEPRPERPDFGNDLMAEHIWQREHKPRERRPEEVDEDHALEHSTHLLVQPEEQFRSSDAEMPWELLDSEEEMGRIEEAVKAVRASRKHQD